MSSLPAMSANFVGELGESGDCECEDECGSGDCWVKGSLPGSRCEAKGSCEVTDGLPVGVLSMPLAAAELDMVTAFAVSTSQDAKCLKRQEVGVYAKLYHSTKEVRYGMSRSVNCANKE